MATKVNSAEVVQRRLNPSGGPASIGKPGTARFIVTTIRSTITPGEGSSTRPPSGQLWPRGVKP